MTKLQASLKDKSASTWRERKLMYKVGSCFKGCRQCGDFTIEVTASGKEKKRYLTGMNVFRAFCPTQLGWTYLCWDCSAKDHRCWEDANDVGEDARLGNREAVRKMKAERRKDLEGQARPKTVVVEHSRASRIEALECQLQDLMKMLVKENN